MTLFLDGHHSKIAYQDINLEKTDFYSYKLKTNGLNTQFIIDCNDICVYMSNSLPCKNNTDDNNFFNKWREDDFDYVRPNEINLSLLNNKISSKTQYRLQNIQNIKNYQNTLLQSTILTLQNIDIMEEDDNITINNSTKYKQKEKAYEIQYIIKHRGSVEDREFYVKWKKYSK